MEVKQLQSQVISFLRFPLAVAVIMIHTSVSDITIGGERLAELMPLPVYDFTYGFLDTVFMQVAVPLFFFISGFLFFFKETGFGLKEYGQKLKKRARTLLVPYIFWNLAMLAIMYLGQVLFPGLLSGNNMMIGEYGVKDYLMSFWDVSYGPFTYERLVMVHPRPYGRYGPFPSDMAHNKVSESMGPDNPHACLALRMGRSFHRIEHDSDILFHGRSMVRHQENKIYKGDDTRLSYIMRGGLHIIRGDYKYYLDYAMDRICR